MGKLLCMRQKGETTLWEWIINRQSAKVCLFTYTGGFLGSPSNLGFLCPCPGGGVLISNSSLWGYNKVFMGLTESHTMHEVNETASDTDKSLNTWTVEHTCITYRYNKLACPQIMSRRGAMVGNRCRRKVGGKCIQGRERERVERRMAKGRCEWEEEGTGDQHFDISSAHWRRQWSKRLVTDHGPVLNLVSLLVLGRLLDPWDLLLLLHSLPGCLHGTLSLLPVALYQTRETLKMDDRKGLRPFLFVCWISPHPLDGVGNWGTEVKCSNRMEIKQSDSEVVLCPVGFRISHPLTLYFAM